MFALLFLLQSGVQAPAHTPRPTHDAIRYSIQLSIPDTGRRIEGVVTTEWRLRSADSLRVELDSVLEVRGVRIGGREVAGWRRSGDVLTIPHQGRAGATLTSVIRYAGVPRDGLIMRDSNGVRTIFADNWPNRAHRWFPSQDHPSDKALADFAVDVPAGLKVIANGEPGERTPGRNGRVTWHYATRHPIPVYTMVVGIAPMAVTTLPPAACAVRCVPQQVWTYPEDSAYAVSGPFRRVGDIVEYFSRTVGPFPFSRLSHVQSSTIFGGMENSTAIFYDQEVYRRRRFGESLVAHETAHQWFGDAVTEGDWTHLWLSEGFATYFAALWAGHVGGDSALQAEMRQAAEAVFRSRLSSRPVIDSAENLLALLNTNNYQKGSWVLHSLRGLIGDSAFFRGIRDYYRRFRDSTALSGDFQSVMEQASGQSLDWYFRQALTQPGFPELQVTSRFDQGALQVTIRQTQPEAWGVYRLPGFELLIDGMLVRVDIEGRESRFSFGQFTGPARSIELDPNGWWLARHGRVGG